MRLIVLIVLCLFAGTAFAQVVVSEIMYSPKGADEGHEWVEVMNAGGTTIDLLKSKFVEGGRNHGLTVAQGGTTLAPNAYAIIADNAQTFLSDYAGFSGIVLDSSFSLKNSGETIAFKMPDGTVSDTVVYTSDMGASGDGNSLQKIGSVWKGASSAPGAGTQGGVSAPATNPPPLNSSNNTAQSSKISNGGGASATFPIEPQIIADAGAEARVVATGAPITFSGKVFGLKKEPIENARMVWSFGDGGSAVGQAVLHTYYYPGEYTVVLDAASGYYSASDRARVTVVKPELSLRVGGDAVRSFVAIENLGSDEIDLSGWLVGVGSNAFVLPKNTFVGARKTLTLPSEVTKLVTPEGGVAELQYPNGAVVSLEKDISPPFSQLPSVPSSRVSSAVVMQKETPVRSMREVPRISFASKTQKAGILDASQDAEINTISPPLSGTSQPDETSWVWYVGVLFLGVFALLGFRYARGVKADGELSAEDFEITEDKEDERAKQRTRTMDF